MQVALALPRDGGLTPIVPRLLDGSDESAPWPNSSAHISLAGPVNLDTFHIKEDVWPEPLSKTSVFIKLDSDYTEDGSDTKQMLDDQLDPTSPTPTRKRKQQSTPKPMRSKRTTARKRRA
ncbi:hypothetical protein NW765_016343 [Fusarium oxysporum]|nr:hypothetical protein NW765_016343 [Fusarium oxysporum]